MRVLLVSLILLTASAAQITGNRTLLATAATGEWVFFGGGVFPNNTVSDLIDVYNSDTNAWTTATLSSARQWLSGAGFGAYAVFAGGIDGCVSSLLSLRFPPRDSLPLSSNTATNMVDVYTAGTWSNTDALSVARYRMASAIANGFIAFSGGYDTNTDLSDAVDLFNTVDGSWSSTTMSQPRIFHASAGTGNFLVIAGGTYVALFA